MQRYPKIPLCRDGEIGIRGSPKNYRPKGLAGSIPVPCTKEINYTGHIHEKNDAVFYLVIVLIVMITVLNSLKLLYGG